MNKNCFLRTKENVPYRTVKSALGFIKRSENMLSNQNSLKTNPRLKVFIFMYPTGFPAKLKDTP